MYPGNGSLHSHYIQMKEQLFVHTDHYPCRNMDSSSRTFALVIFCLLSLHGSKANLQNVYLTPTKKPLQCHEIAVMEIRSVVKCALHCVGNLYSCAGFVYDRNENSQLQCIVCLLYDVKTSPTTVETSSTAVSIMPEISRNTGEIPFGQKSIDSRFIYIFTQFIHACAYTKNNISLT